MEKPPGRLRGRFARIESRYQGLDERANDRRHFRQRFRRRLLHQANDRAAHDHAIDRIAQHAHVGRLADAETAPLRRGWETALRQGE
jgi:hypothetical protein